LGRTGRSMVISDTAVGIGKVPEAQLDVKGMARFVHAEATDTLACESIAYGIRENLTTPRDHSCLAQRKAKRGNPCVMTFKLNWVNSWVPGVILYSACTVNTNSSNLAGYTGAIGYRRLSTGGGGTGDIDITLLDGGSSSGAPGSVTPVTDSASSIFNVVYESPNIQTSQDTLTITFSGGGARDIFIAEVVDYSRLYY
jgi:hypothetical protein